MKTNQFITFLLGFAFSTACLAGEPVLSANLSSPDETVFLHCLDSIEKNGYMKVSSYNIDFDKMTSSQVTAQYLVRTRALDRNPLNQAFSSGDRVQLERHQDGYLLILEGRKFIFFRFDPSDSRAVKIFEPGSEGTFLFALGQAPKLDRDWNLSARCSFRTDFIESYVRNNLSWYRRF
ncbi:MAG: hypothetical protein EOP09_02935 [Proteobacteria bacterium]|nr:MAG: hypothetical protein EOP09_02935 [Pseudomonadota bacterium]